MPRRGNCGSARRLTAYSATNISPISGSTQKLANSDQMRSGAKTNKLKVAAVIKTKNRDHAAVTRRV